MDRANPQVDSFQQEQRRLLIWRRCEMSGMEKPCRKMRPNLTSQEWDSGGRPLFLQGKMLHLPAWKAFREIHLNQQIHSNPFQPTEPFRMQNDSVENFNQGP